MTTDITTPADTDAPAGQDPAPAAPGPADRKPRRTRPGVPSLLARRLRRAGRATATPTATAGPAASAAPTAPATPAAPEASAAPGAPDAPAASAASVVPAEPGAAPAASAAAEVLAASAAPAALAASATPGAPDAPVPPAAPEASAAPAAPATPVAPATPAPPDAPAAPVASTVPGVSDALAAPAAPDAPAVLAASAALDAPAAPAPPATPAPPAALVAPATSVASAAPAPLDALVAPAAPAAPDAPAATDAPAAPDTGSDVATASRGTGRAPSAVRKAAGALGRLLRAAALRSAALVALLALWETAPRLGLVDATFLPPVSEVATAWWDLLGNGQLGQHTRASLARSFGGFGIAVVIAVPLGLLIGWYRPVAALLGPLLEVFRNTAALALLPVFVLLLGIGETSKVSIVVYACLWPVLLNTISAVGNADPTLVRLARSMDLSTPRLFQKVILPSSVPAIFTGIRLAGAVSILVLVAAEMIGAKAGLGYLINASQYNFAIPQMYAGIITISAVGVAFNQLLVTIERRLSTWRVPA
ncbi:ABC transporter permease [Streptomyces sp. NPDC001552]|uniref:ABC transporter permease n=1 Tax=Streptomyces sp. NPDC001552 TaxID=3364587 RepID=UPI0036A10D75